MSKYKVYISKFFQNKAYSHAILVLWIWDPLQILTRVWGEATDFSSSTEKNTVLGAFNKLLR